MPGPTKHKKAKRNATRGVPLKTAREVADLESSDGDWSLDKLAAEIAVPVKTAPKTRGRKRESELRLTLAASVKEAQVLLLRAGEQWEEIVNHAKSLKAIGKRVKPEDLRHRAIALAGLIGKADLAKSVPGAAQTGLMLGLRYMALKTIQDWPRPPGAQEKTAMWDLLREVTAEHPNIDSATIGLVYAEAANRYEKRNPHGPKFLSWHTVFKYFPKKVLGKAGRARPSQAP